MVTRKKMNGLSTGDSLKSLRKKQGLSQVGLSIKSGVRQSTISAIERGSDPTGKILKSLAMALNVTTDKLLDYENSKEVSK